MTICVATIVTRIIAIVIGRIISIIGRWHIGSCQKPALLTSTLAPQARAFNGYGRVCAQLYATGSGDTNDYGYLNALLYVTCFCHINVSGYIHQQQSPR